LVDSKLVSQLLEKLSEQTSYSNLHWLSLPQYFETNKNEPLRRYVIDKNKYAYSGRQFTDKPSLISEYRSQCVTIERGLVILFIYYYKESANTEHYALAVQVDNTCEVTVLDCSAEQQEKIHSLYKLITNTQYDIVSFIKGIVERF